MWQEHVGGLEEEEFESKEVNSGLCLKVQVCKERLRGQADSSVCGVREWRDGAKKKKDSGTMVW